MKKFWTAYLNNDPYMSLGAYLSTTFLMVLLLTDIVFWKAILFWLVASFAYHFVRGFLKAAFSQRIN